MTDSKDNPAIELVRAADKGVPMVGGPLGSLMDNFIPKEIDRRRDMLLKALEYDFKTLEEHLNENVITKPYFASIFLQSFKSAIATENEEKINCFRAIVVNTSIASEPNVDQIKMMLKITEGLTPLHIKLIKLFSDPNTYLSQNHDASTRMAHVTMGGLNALTSACLPNYDKDLIKAVLKDLETSDIGRGLDSGVTMTRNGILSPRLTDFGKKYLSFITLPSELSTTLEHQEE